MQKVMAIVAVLALVLNGYVVYNEYIAGGGGGGWLSNDDDGDGEKLDDLTVVVPPFKYGDVATYDYEVMAELYFKDYGSGNWSIYRLTVNGNLRHWYHTEPVEARDGFWEKHNSVKFEMDTQASLEIFVDSHDSEPLIIEGGIDGERNEYFDLKDRRTVNTLTDGNVEIDQLPRTPIPLSYSGMMEAYPNPNIEEEASLDEQIYLGGKEIKKKDNGSVVQSMYYEAYDFNIDTIYNWTADEAEVISGYKTLHINITSLIFWGALQFNEEVWISNDCPFPIKRTTRTNQTWEWEEDGGGISWIIMETTNTLQDGGYSEGTTEIPWGTGTSTWLTRNPAGEYKEWDYLPVGGNGFSASSFDFKPEVADSHARQHSAGLQRFLQKYDRPGRGVTCVYAVYNATRDPTDINGKAGTYRWNLTYGYAPTIKDMEDARETGERNFTYNLVLIKNVTKDPLKPLQNEYIEEIEIEYDWGLRRDSAAEPKEYMPKQALTLASGEDILMRHPKVKDVVGDRNDEIGWDDDVQYGIMNVGLGGSTEGLMLVEILTGITTPKTDYAWALQKGTIWESGDTFTAAVDAENGQIVYVMEISGTALFGIFG